MVSSRKPHEYRTKTFGISLKKRPHSSVLARNSHPLYMVGQIVCQNVVANNFDLFLWEDFYVISI
jgi:hypothetical protein